MFRVTRIVVAAVLSLAVASLPVVLDQCAGSCEAHQHVAAGTTACHHAASAGTHVSRVPSRCGHDHNATVLSAAKGSVAAGRAFGSIVAPGGEPAMVPAVVAGLRLRPHSPPEASSTVDRRSLPLRV